MKISWQWLQRHVDLTGLDPHDIFNRFTMSVAELEGIETVGESYDKVLTARVKTVTPHEQSTKLQLVELDLGDRTVTAVSGAPNVREGIIVPFALPGTRMEGVEGQPEVRVAEIAGVHSPGMTCSERELGFSDNHEGVAILPDGTPVGVPLTDFLPARDHILEIDNKSITHRPDLWGHRGIAREIAALVGRPLREFDETIPETDGDPLSVSVEAPDLCPRYAAQVFDGLRIGPSPLWLKIFLSRVGVRPISNVVDLTNFVMLDVGNPLHAFDSRYLEGDTILVRRARPEERITTLDDIERELSTDDLLIADAHKGVALAGVMGGENSEIRDDTSRMVLEAAAFDASGIRRTASRLGMRTEASARFEKALDPHLPLQATALFSRLLREVVPGARVASRLYDVAEPDAEPTIVRIAPEFIRRKLGAPVETDRMEQMLTGIGFAVAREGDDFVITVPTWRATRDVGIREDIVEEIGRLYGYDNIAPEPILAPVKPIPRIPIKDVEKQVRRAMVASGYREVMTYSFDSAALAETLGYSLEGAVELANPISSDMPVLRRHLLPNLLQAAAKNSQFRETFRIFEVGRVFYPAPAAGEVPHQERRLAGLVFERGGDNFDLFRRVKAHVEALFAGLSRGPVRFGEPGDATNQPWAVPGKARGIYFGAEMCGTLSMLNPVVRDALKLRGKVAYFEVNLEPALIIPEEKVLFQPLPRFPAIQNDLSVLVGMEVPYARVAESIRDAAGDLLDELELFAIYRGDPIPTGQKSLSFHLRFRSPERTLTDAEVEPRMEQVLAALKADVGGEIRT